MAETDFFKLIPKLYLIVEQTWFFKVDGLISHTQFRVVFNNV